MMNIFKRFLQTSAALTLTLAATAQDIHFSQFYAAPLQLNPALTGVMACDMRATANYRNQWSSVTGASNSFQTYQAAFDSKLPVARHDYVGLGFNLYSDRAGSGSFGTVNGTASFSYIKRLSGLRANESHLSAGVYLGIAQRDIKTSTLLFGDMWDGRTSNAEPGKQTIDPDVLALNPAFIYTDMGAGITYFAALNRANTSNYYLGLAFAHLNQPNMAFNRDPKTTYPLYTRINIHAGAELGLGSKFAVVPTALYMTQGPSWQFNLGTSFKVKTGTTRKPQSFSIGGQVRLSNGISGMISDAAIVMARFDSGPLGLGLSYDVNMSSLTPASSGNGSFELSLMYKFFSNRKRKMACPEF